MVPLTADNPAVRDVWSQLQATPVCVRSAVIAGATACVVGGLVRLVVGLQHPATVWFAILEAALLVGVPATVLGLVAGLMVMVGRAMWRLFRRD
jgi:hypothetical protein